VTGSPTTLRERVRAAWKRLRGGELTPARAAASVSVGLLIGATPLYGLHLILVMAVCVPLKLDVPLSYLAANISLPFFAPFLSLAEIETGALVRSGAWRDLSPAVVRRDGITPYLGDAIVGVGVFAPALAAVGGALTYGLARLVQRLRARSVREAA
jgi:uncharacterized protein (DUF2062 family)